MQSTEKQSKGLQYESFIIDWFAENKRINLSHYTTTQEQFTKGENRQGIEIKNDQMFAKTGDLFISVERDYGYTKYPSGIYKQQSWLYVIGNKEVFYIFATKHLQQYFEKHTPNLFNGFISNKNGTEKGFLLNAKLADRICIEKVTSQTKLF